MIYQPRLNPDAPAQLPAVLPSAMDELFNSAQPAPEMLVPPPYEPRPRPIFLEWDFEDDYEYRSYPDDGLGHPNDFGDR